MLDRRRGGRLVADGRARAARRPPRPPARRTRPSPCAARRRSRTRSGRARSSTAARAASTSPSRAASSACSAPSTPRYCGSRESTASSAARSRCPRAAARSSRAERELGVPQAGVELRAARAAPARVGVAHRLVGRLPVAGVEGLLGDQQREPGLARRQVGELVARASRATVERLLRAADQVQRVGQVHGRHGAGPCRCRAPRASASAPRSACGALLHLARRHQRHAERVERADLVDERRRRSLVRAAPARRAPGARPATARW